MSDEPQERTETLRSAVIQALRERTLSARELSAQVGVPEREIAAHLEHIERSLRHTQESLVVLPPRCLKCGFVFEARERRSKPSRCPKCKSERIEPARFSVVLR